MGEIPAITDCCQGFERSDGAIMHSDDCPIALASMQKKPRTTLSKKDAGRG